MKNTIGNELKWSDEEMMNFATEWQLHCRQPISYIISVFFEIWKNEKLKINQEEN